MNGEVQPRKEATTPRGFLHLYLPSLLLLHSLRIGKGNPNARIRSQSESFDTLSYVELLGT